MAKDLDISPAELSAIECGRKPVPDWFVSKLQEKYGIGDMHAQSLIKFMKERGDSDCPGTTEKTQRDSLILSGPEEHRDRGGTVPQAAPYDL